MTVKKDYHMAVISSIICCHIGNNIKYKIKIRLYHLKVLYNMLYKMTWISYDII